MRLDLATKITLSSVTSTSGTGDIGATTGFGTPGNILDEKPLLPQDKSIMEERRKIKDRRIKSPVKGLPYFYTRRVSDRRQNK